jgi:hypothetical protein
MTADDQFKLSVNGKEIASATNFNSIQQISLKEHLKGGANQIQVIAENRGSGPNPAGLIGVFSIETNQGQTVITTDAQWQCASANSGDSKRLRRLLSATMVCPSGAGFRFAKRIFRRRVICGRTLLPTAKLERTFIRDLAGYSSALC